jgi:hypothetical protein
VVGWEVLIVKDVLSYYFAFTTVRADSEISTDVQGKQVLSRLFTGIKQAVEPFNAFIFLCPEN